MQGPWPGLLAATTAKRARNTATRMHDILVNLQHITVDTFVVRLPLK